VTGNPLTSGASKKLKRIASVNGMKISRPYLGPFVSKPVDWTPLKNYDRTFRTLGLKKPKEKDVWQFTTFLID